ncbi:MAG: hypothetical protein E7314_02560 [Clostridiales bacterium]|nr:hypothetical protein [Clostridiales bacterium]
MSEVIITQEKLSLMDDLSNNFKLTYKLFEEEDKYQIEVVKKEDRQGLTIKETCRTDNINSYNDAVTLINILIKNKVTPISIRDVLEDFND